MSGLGDRWTGVRRKRGGSSESPARPSPQAEPQTEPETDGGTIRGWVDAPFDGRPMSAGVHHVEGWTFHESRPLRGVVVTVDGGAVGAVATGEHRPDVAAAFPRATGADRSGWQLDIDLTPFAGRVVELAVHGLLGLPRRGRPLGPSSQVFSVLVPVVGLDGRADGQQVGHHEALFMERPPLAAGYHRIQGLAEAAGGASRVEVSVDGGPPVRARTNLPGRLGLSDQGPHSALALFEAVVLVPDGVSTVELSGQVTPRRGAEPFAITPLRVPVLPTEPVRLAEGRLELVRERLWAPVEQLRARRPLGEPGRDAPRVLIVTHDLGLGGGQLYLQDLLRLLHRQGTRGAVVSPRGGVLLEELEQLGFPVLVTGDVDPHDIEAYEALVARIAAWAAQHDCDVALANTLSAYAGADAALRAGLGVVWAVHESFPLDRFWSEVCAPPVPHHVARRTREVLAASDRVVFEAARTRDELVPPVTDEAAAVVAYGVDVEVIDRFRDEHDRGALRRDLGLGDDTLVLLCMGTIEPRKGQLDLVLALADCEAARDREVALVLVGATEHSAYTDALRGALVELDEHRVRVEPVQSEVHRWYHAADVLVCASDTESLPRSMLEAMAFETPVASTDVFGIPELVEDGVCGWLCGPRDLDELGRLLERVVTSSPQQRAEMGRAARRTVLDDHDPAVHARFFADELSRAAARRR